MATFSANAVYMCTKKTTLIKMLYNFESYHLKFKSWTILTNKVLVKIGFTCTVN